MIALKDGQDPNTPKDQLIWVKTKITEQDPIINRVEFSEESIQKTIDNIDNAIAEFTAKNLEEKKMWDALLTEIKNK